MAGRNYGTMFVETFGTSSPVTGSAPTAEDDGQPLPGLSAVTLAVSSAVGTTLSGAGSMRAYMYDPAILSPDGVGVATDDPDMKLAYDAQSVNFVLATTARGITSGATGVIGADSDSGATGTLTLTSVTGTFADNEPIGVAHATANGTALPAVAYALGFDGQSGNFVLGEVVTGGDSGATGTVLAQVDAGATGTLYLGSVVGTFENNEAIAGDVAGAAVVNGTQALSPVAFLNYDAQTGNFAVGLVVSGATSLATGIITADTDAGATGKLALVAVDGDFEDNEIITDSATGSATVNLLQYKTLAYDAQTTNFSLGQVVYGATSGATGTIQADSDSGTTGTLSLKLLTGTFADNELLVVQYALANGSQRQEVAYQSAGPDFEVGQVVVGQTSGASGTLTAATASLLTIANTGPTLFVDGERLDGASQPRWVRLPSADFSVTASAVRDVAFDPVVVETPRRESRFKWVPDGVTFSAGSGGITVHQLGYAPGSSFTTGTTGGR